MEFNDREKKIITIYSVLIIGIAFLFFLFGTMYANYNVYMMLEHIQIQELNIDLNETKIVDYIFDITQIPKSAIIKEANLSLIKTQ